ncbi:MAG: chemotaxis protein CheA, partial [Desulfobacterales bacterium]|nr:chemotaxis protein CheA [Desulfobacterales bacterium]
TLDEAFHSTLEKPGRQAIREAWEEQLFSREEAAPAERPRHEVEEAAPEKAVAEAPAAEPPTEEPPATEAPATEPPAAEPPAAEAPATEPPAAEAPATEPPTTEPPAAEAPATEPPTTEPPAAEALPGEAAAPAESPAREEAGGEAEAADEIPGRPEVETEKETPAPPEERRRRKPFKPPERILKHSIRVDAKKIDILMNQAGEMVTNRAYFSQLLSDFGEFQHTLAEIDGLDPRMMKTFRSLSFRLGEATLSLGRVANELQEGVMKMRMLPISQLFNRYPRLVRDLHQDTGKKVRLVIKGEETELDRMVIEEISDPLVHIIRNVIDHGIERPETRVLAGKPEEGALTLNAFHESNNVVIEITDDGRGIDLHKVKATALENGFITEEQAAHMAPNELMGLIMKPGFSTAGRVTKTSGRGVGMDVVRKNIEKLNGTIEIDSIVNRETSIRIKIPLTLAIIRALLVRVGAEIFTIPLTAVEETLRVFEGETDMIEKFEVLHLRGVTLPLLRLSEIFSIPSLAGDKYFVVVVSEGNRKVGLVVDALIGQEEAVIKPLEDYLQEDSGFSGATILGDGRISLILDVYELVRLSIDSQRRRRRTVISPGKVDGEEAPETVEAGEV